MGISVTMDDKVRKFVKKKGGTLTVSTQVTQGCCVSFENLDFSYKKPKNPNYLFIEQDGLSIYLERGMPVEKENLHLSLMGKSIFTSIYVDGLAVGAT